MPTRARRRSLALALGGLALLVCGASAGRALNIEDFGAAAGGRADDIPLATANRDALNRAIASASEGDTVLVPANKSYLVLGGVVAQGKRGLVVQIEGTLKAADCGHKPGVWPDDGARGKVPFILMSNCAGVAVHGGGLVDGSGLAWWDAVVLGELKGDRPHLVVVENSTDLVFEHISLINSPQFHLQFVRCARVTVRFLRIAVDRERQRALRVAALERRLAAGGNRLEGPIDWLFDQVVKLLPRWALQPEDLNTDGIDPQGKDFHIHDCIIDNDDDSIAVKPSDGRDATSASGTACSENMLIENMVLTGFGASIGSVPPNADVGCVRNITFRNVSMPGTGKGIYIKSNPDCGRPGALQPQTAIIADILYEDFVITRPWWWAVWIGPQQQHEPHTDLDEKCSLLYPMQHRCPTQGCATFANITLRNVLIDDPLLSPGVVMGNSSNPMRNVTFENVRVRFSENPLRGRLPFGRAFQCINADVRNTGGSSPGVSCETRSHTLSEMPAFI